MESVIYNDDEHITGLYKDLQASGIDSVHQKPQNNYLYT